MISHLPNQELSHLINISWRRAGGVVAIANIWAAWRQGSFLSSSVTLFSSSIFSSIRAFSNESVLHIWWPKYWSFSISPSSEYSVLISFTIDLFDLLEVQGTLQSLHQHHNSKAPILLFSAFLMVQLSHLYMTTGKIIALTRQTCVGSHVSAF